MNGMAGRAFLHNADMMLLDEPTSNLDSLNEAVILKVLRDEAAGRTVAVPLFDIFLIIINRMS